ncbi:MAG: serine/threonine protein kinase [Sandaracinaceae bacterium]
MPQGDIVAGRYRMVRSIGDGPSGSLHVACVTDAPGTWVAIQRVVQPTEPSRMSQREVDLIFRDTHVPHRGVLNPIETGWDAGSLFFTMPLLHGTTLEAIRDPREASDLIEAALDPLEAIHDRGLAHGCLCLRSIWTRRTRERRRSAAILDLGVDRALSEYGVEPPRDRRFLAPELLRGEGAGPEADIWAIGALLYYVHAGRGPFEDSSADSDPHVPLGELAPQVDDVLASLIDLCLRKSPAERPPHARALRRLFGTMRSASGWQVHSNTVLDQSGAAPPPPPGELQRALQHRPMDPEPHRALYGWYREKNIFDGAWLCAAALRELGQARPAETRFAAFGHRRATVDSDRGLDQATWAALLHPDQEPRVDAVWSEVAEALANVHRASDEPYRSAPKIALGARQGTLGRLIAEAVSAFALRSLPAFVRGRRNSTLMSDPTVPPTTSVPEGFEEPLPEASLRFAIGRHLATHRAAHRVCIAIDDPVRLESAFGAALVLGGHESDNVEWIAGAADLGAVIREGHLRALRIVVSRLGSEADRVDLGTWRRSVELSCARAGLLFSADLEAARWMLRWSRVPRRVPLEDSEADLFRFWSSGEHVRLRHALDLGELLD